MVVVGDVAEGVVTDVVDVALALDDIVDVVVADDGIDVVDVDVVVWVALPGWC